MGRSPHFVAPLELGVCVADIGRMSAFYTEVLGCTEMARARLAGARTAAIGLADGDVVWLQTSTGERIKLLEPDTPPGPAQGGPAAPLTARPGVAYLTFHVDDLTSRADAALAAGATALVADVVHDSGSGVMIAFFRDPEGNVIELVQRADLHSYRPDV
jgi:catechol 2,3-dioxygenase-like lactoylglutathione lyase family enzyme